MSALLRFIGLVFVFLELILCGLLFMAVVCGIIGLLRGLS
jgi:hypothetical protein